MLLWVCVVRPVGSSSWCWCCGALPCPMAPRECVAPRFARRLDVEENESAVLLPVTCNSTAESCRRWVCLLLGTRRSLRTPAGQSQSLIFRAAPGPATRSPRRGPDVPHEHVPHPAPARPVGLTYQQCRPPVQHQREGDGVWPSDSDRLYGLFSQ
jgi:hypothetical protein